MVHENTSDYGTMSNQVEDQLLEDLIPNLNLSQDSQGNDGSIFNDITVHERQERIQSIINDIMSVPKLSEAGLTQRGALSQEKIRKYLSHENLSSRNGSSVSGMTSKQSVMKFNNRNSGMKRTSSMHKFESKPHNGNGYSSKPEIEIKAPIIPKSQSRMASNLHQKNGQNKVLNNMETKKSTGKLRVAKSGELSSSSKARTGPMAVTRNNQPASGKAKKLENSISMDHVPLAPVQGFSIDDSLLGDDTQAELRIHPPTLGDDTVQSNQDSSTSFHNLTSNSNLGEMIGHGLSLDLGNNTSHENSVGQYDHQYGADDRQRNLSAGKERVDYLQQNIRSASSQNRKGSGNGRNTADSAAGSQNHKHKAGAVPKYLKQRKQQWRDEAQAILDSAPDPDCPPGHVRLPDEDRAKQLEEMQSTHTALLANLNRLPVSSDTRRVTEKRREIEGLLAGLDDGIRIYSRPKVFVKE